MVIYNPAGQPEGFVCVGTPEGSYCGIDGIQPMENLGSKDSMLKCAVCNRGQSNLNDRIRYGAAARLGYPKSSNIAHIVSEIGAAQWELEKNRERALLLAGTSTESVTRANYLSERGMLEPLTITGNGDSFVEVQPQEDAAPAPNHGTEIHEDLPAGQGGGHQTTATNGHVYILTHPLIIGWLKIGMTRYPNARLRNYNTGDPENRYHMEHTVAVPHQRNAESSAHELAELADSFEGRSETGRREWFRMSLEDARAILNQIGTPLENDD